LIVSVGLVAGAIFLPSEAFLVRFSYDDDHVDYRSPLAAERRAPCAQLRDVGYSRGEHPAYRLGLQCPKRSVTSGGEQRA
jgi:hypothetical protein